MVVGSEAGCGSKKAGFAAISGGLRGVSLDLSFSYFGPALALSGCNLLTRFGAQDALTFGSGGTIRRYVTIAGALQQSLHLLQP
jgi:hypothetical protein